MTPTGVIRRQLVLAYVSSGVALTGVQAILPALPSMQQGLSLSESQVALVTSLYLLPSAVFSTPLGFLADRFGRRCVYLASFTAFGLAGLGLSTGPGSFGVILALRIVQGTAFGAILPLTITLIGDLRQGTEMIAAQGHRAVTMHLTEAILPVIGGALAMGAWWRPFSLQLLALPLVPLGWWLLEDTARPRNEAGYPLRRLIKLVRTPAVLSFEGANFLRFFFKFAYFTYLPLLLAQKSGVAVGFVGWMLGLTALAGMSTALLAGRLAGRGTPSRWIGLSLSFFAVALALLAMNLPTWALLLVGVAFGAADGVYSVFLNALAAGTTSADLRASFVAITGTVRNLGKFAAPTAMGVILLWTSLDGAFLVAASLGGLSLFFVPFLRRLDSNLATGEATLGIDQTLGLST